MHAAQALQQDYPQAPNVSVSPVLLRTQPLRRHIKPSPDICVRLLPRRDFLADPKVSYFDISHCIYQDVVRLQVPVDYLTHRMQVVEPLKDLQRDHHHYRLFDLPILAKELIQRS